MRLTELCDNKLKMASSHHPQTDRSSEIYILMLGNYLMCYFGHHPRDWDTLMRSAEFEYNSRTLESLGSSSFELDLGWLPRLPLDMRANKRDENLQSITEFKQSPGCII